MLVVDDSDSITFETRENWVKLKDFLKQIVSEFQVGPDMAQIGLITFRLDVLHVFDTLVSALIYIYIM